MNLERIKRLPELALLLVLLAVGLLFFTLTNPNSVPLVFLVFGFLILAAIIYCTLRLIGKTTGLSNRVGAQKYSGLLIGGTVLPVALLALQSIGQLTLRDAVTLLILFVAGY